jgi:hypothetical protein
MKTFLVKKDFDVVTNNDDGKVFQVISILDQENNDYSGKASGLFFKSDTELVNYLKSNVPLKDDEQVNIVEDV